MEFVGSRDSDVYHWPADRQKIKPENLVKCASAHDGTRLHKGCPK